MNAQLRRSCTVVALVVGVCTTIIGASAATARTTTPRKPAVDPSTKLFDPSVVHEITIDLAAADIPLLQPLGEERAHATLTVDGVVLDTVGVRLKQGIGSYDNFSNPLESKAAFSIKTDEFVEGQQVFGVRKFTLGNAIWEPSFVSESLAYSVFRSAGIPAARAALANVHVDGELFGLYVMRESFDKRFLERNFADPEGNLYEAPFGIDISDTRMELRTNETRNDKRDIEQLARVVNETPDAEYTAAVGKIVDLHEFFTYWALETLIAHWDGYVSLSWTPFFNLDNPQRNDNYRPNNYYAYQDPARGKFVFLPWGADQSFGTGLHRGSGASVPVLAPPKEMAKFAAKLYAQPGNPERLRTRILRVLDRFWDPTALLAQANGFAALVRANGLTASREVTTLAGFEEAFAERRAFIVDRAAAVRSELAALPPG